MGSPDDWVVTVAAACACLLACVALLHAVVAMGSSIGLHLWGADRTELPCLLRAASVATVLGLSLGALVVWGRAGRSTAAGWDDRLVASLTWTFSASLFVAALLAHSSGAASNAGSSARSPCWPACSWRSWPGEGAASAAGDRDVGRVAATHVAGHLPWVWPPPRGGQGRGPARRD